MARTNSYGNLSISIIFKTSNRKNAKTKTKTWKNKNIDQILSMKKIPGIPEKAIILKIKVG
jgi:hypothetical protein|tara:strand:- start:142 stop:324 length:183 start_codon:yes stop_codon:yes gene_type:complete